MNIEQAENVVPYLVETLSSRLNAGQRVVWLVPGGSGISVACAVAAELTTSSVDLTELYVTLTDERYGEVGHRDENWQQLLDAGFAAGDAVTYRVLQDGLTLQETTAKFDETLRDWLARADYSLGLFGIGSDGHTSGIKPGSPSTTNDSWAVGYKWDDYTRVTSSPQAIQALDEAALYATGTDKAGVLKTLLLSELPIDQQPAQVLKQVPKCTLFTDYKEK